MSGSLQQYIDLYRANAATVDNGSAPVLNAVRPRALEALEGASLPVRGDEGFEKTSLDEMFAPDYGLNIARVNIPVDVTASFRCDVPNLSTLLGFIANDTFVPSSTLIKNLPAGVTVMSLRRAAVEHHDLVARHYATVAPLGTTSVALNTLLAQDGVFIHIADGVHLDKPIQIVNIFSSPTPLMAVRRLLIVAGRHSAANILLCDHSQNESAYLSSQVSEVICGEGSDIHIYDIEESSANTSRCAATYVRQDDGSSFVANTTTLLNGISRNDFNIQIDGRHASAGLYGMAIGSGRQHIDNSSSVIHQAPQSSSNQLFKYVLDDNASGAFEGGIEVTPSAPMTEAFQSNNNILASDGARMHTKPQLLIYNDDVKCSHGTTTGQLDDSALFYMQTRGIPADEARTMLMQAFMVDVISTVNVEAVRDRLRHLVEKRFSGTLAVDCSGCRACN